MGSHGGRKKCSASGQILEVNLREFLADWIQLWATKNDQKVSTRTELSFTKKNTTEDQANLLGGGILEIGN